MKGSRSLVKTLARVALVLNCCLSTTSGIFSQNLVAASTITVYSQEDIYNARLVFTNDVYPRISKQLSQRHYPTSFGTEATKNNEIRYYLYFDNNGNIKIKISPEQWNALNVIKNAFGLKDIMDVVNNANVYIVNPEFNLPRVPSAPMTYPTQPQIINQASNMQQRVLQAINLAKPVPCAQQNMSTPKISFDHYKASRKNIADVLGFLPSSLNNVNNFDDLLNHIKNKANELIYNKSKLDSKDLSRYKKCLKAINDRIYKFLSSNLTNFDYYVFAWGKTLEQLEYEWDAIYKAYRELEKEHKNGNIFVCYKDKKSNLYVPISNVSYDRKDSGLGVGKIMNYGYPPVKEITEVLLSSFNI